MDFTREFTKLHELVTRQKGVIDRLIATGEEQTKCLQNSDHKALQQVLREQHTLAAELNRLEEERFQLQKNLAGKIGLPEDATLKELAAHAGPQVKDNLEKLRNSLREKTRRLQQVNEINKDLTASALHFTNFMLKLLRPQESAYTPSGTVRQDSKSSLKLNKKV